MFTDPLATPDPSPQNNVGVASSGGDGFFSDLAPEAPATLYKWGGRRKDPKETEVKFVGGLEELLFDSGMVNETGHNSYGLPVKTKIALTIRGLVWSGRVLPPASPLLVCTLVSSLVCTSAISIVF